MKIKIFSFAIVFTAFLFLNANAFACSPSPGGDLTITSSCSFSGTVNGVDNGGLTISSAATLTINAGQTIAWNPALSITLSSGSIAIASTGQLKQTYLWMTDADSDGYAASTTQFAQDTAPSNGRRRYLMASLSVLDCNDAAASSSNTCLTNVDPTGSNGVFTSIYCLSSTDCKISYHYSDGQDLKMADCNDATCSSRTLTTVDSTTSANTGFYTAIYCLSSTDCKIAYYDSTNQNLMMADCDDATCSTRTLVTVDSTSGANTGVTPSIYCLSSTDCKIAYKDTTNTNLMMADCDDATCSTRTLTTVDSTTSANTGASTSIYCLSSTDCKISYNDGTNLNLMMADCDDATCSSRTLTTVDSTTSADTGTWTTSIYCLSSTDCKISYQDTTNTNLMMADCNDATCSTRTLTTVDSTTSAITGRYNSIYCLSSTDCRIAYDANVLMMADCDNATCSSRTLTTVDSTAGAVYISIYCLSSTNCKISYRRNNQLWMADLEP